MSIVSDSDHSGLFELPHFSEFTPFEFFRDTPTRIDINHVELSRSVDNIPHLTLTINCRVRIRHSHNGRDASSNAGSWSRLDSFFIFASRLTKMYLEIDESWCDDHACSIYECLSVHCEVFSYGLYFSVFNEYVDDLISIIRWIDHTTISNKDTHIIYG